MDTLIGLDFVDFQSLEKTSIDFDPGLSLITGPSNLGKSAATRALKALVYNASATGLVREGAKQCEVTARFADSQKVSLIKGKDKSEYYLNSDMFAKSGANDVPDAIKQFWNIATPDGRQLCFAGQHDTPFLLAEPASAVAKVLGDLTNASMLMEAVQRANKLRTAALADAKARQREADEAREEMLTHKGLRARGKALERARKAYKLVESEATAWQTLVQLFDAFTKLEQEKIELAQLTEKNVNLSELEIQAVQKVQELRALEQLSVAYNDMKSTQRQIAASIDLNETRLKEVNSKITTLLEDSEWCPLCEQRIEH